MGFLWSVERPVRYGDVLGCHLPWALLSGAVLLAAFILPPGGIGLRTCTFLRLTGYPCMMCGYTRAFIAMADGDWPHVLQFCPAAALLYAIVGLTFAWNAVAMIFRVRLRRGPWLENRVLRAAGAILAAMILANWVYRLSAGLK